MAPMLAVVTATVKAQLVVFEECQAANLLAAQANEQRNSRMRVRQLDLPRGLLLDPVAVHVVLTPPYR